MFGTDVKDRNAIDIDKQVNKNRPFDTSLSPAHSKNDSVQSTQNLFSRQSLSIALTEKLALWQTKKS